MSKPRHYRAKMSTFTVTQIHLSNPWVNTFWAFAFPGFGNLILGMYAKGLLLFGWEIFINTKAKVNLAILYSLLGQFETAKTVLDSSWILLYVGIYVYSMWTSYRTTVELNKLSLLAEREDAPVTPVLMNTWDINFLDKRKPWLSVVWSFLMPGLGHLYVHKFITGAFIMVYTIILVYFSHILQAIHYTMIGDYVNSKTVLDMQWTLYIPSIYAFIAYDAYVAAVEGNKLFAKEQSRFLRENYQSAQFWALQQSGQTELYVIGSFEHSLYLDMALTALEQKGIPKEHILAVPLERIQAERKLFDTIHRADGVSMVDLAAILGTVFMLLGVIYGYVLRFGPIIWGAIGLVSGFVLGFLIKWLLLRKQQNKQEKNSAVDVIVIVNCADKERRMVELTLWDHLAFGVAYLPHFVPY
ncbi:MAG: putative rane protein [Bacilli bacterium]|nr:putative rane protein [Bacilli bacterium]